MKAAHDCHHHGHVWLEDESGKLFVRHHGRLRGLVAVRCAHCPKTAHLEAFAKHTAPPLPGSVPKSP